MNTYTCHGSYEFHSLSRKETKGPGELSVISSGLLALKAATRDYFHYWFTYQFVPVVVFQNQPNGRNEAAFSEWPNQIKLNLGSNKILKRFYVSINKPFSPHQHNVRCFHCNSLMESVKSVLIWSSVYRAEGNRKVIQGVDLDWANWCLTLVVCSLWNKR